VHLYRIVPIGTGGRIGEGQEWADFCEHGTQQETTNVVAIRA
jgi:hypothetical protein